MTNMNDIEEGLKRALKRQDPPADFTGRVMDRLASGQNLESEPSPGPNKVLRFRLRPKVMVWLAAAAAACLIGLFVTRSYMADRGRIPGSGPAAGVEANLPAQPQLQGNNGAESREKHGDVEPHDLVGSGEAAGLQPARHRIRRRHPVAAPSEEARQAEEQLKLALAITSAKLGYAQRSIQEADGASTPYREVNR